MCTLYNLESPNSSNLGAPECVPMRPLNARAMGVGYKAVLRE
jgi:hypothetical protein